jgi:hypothetical protein
LVLATFRRKIRFSVRLAVRRRRVGRAQKAKALRATRRAVKKLLRGVRYLAIARPMLMRLSAMMPNPTHRFIPASSL